MIKPDWEKLATTLQGLGVPKSPPNPAITPVNFKIKPAPTTPTAQKGGMVDIPAGYNYSSTQGLYKDPSYGITNAQQNLMNELQPMTAEQSILRERDIQSQMQALWQPRIDAIAKIYEDRLGEARQRATAREAQQRAIQGSKGILTSEAGQAKVAQAEEIGKEDLQNIMNQQNLAMQEVYGKISDEARTRLEAERAEKLGFAEKSLELKNKLATQAMDNLKTLGAAGIDLTKLKSNSEVYKSLQEGTGLSDLEMDAYLRSSQGDNIVKSDLKDLGNGKIVGYYLDKAGQWHTQEFQTDKKDTEEFWESKDGTPYWLDKTTKQLRPATGYIESPDKALDRQLKQMQIAKGYSEMAEKKAGAITDTSGLKIKYDMIDGLQKDENTLDAVLDKNILTGLHPRSWLALPKDQKGYIAKIDQLVSKENIDSLISAKAKGATFGALSDNELRMLGNAATLINSWKITDKEGHILGYSANKDDFKKELQTLKDLTQKAIEKSGGNLKKTIDDYRKEFPNATTEELNALMQEENQ